MNFQHAIVDQLNEKSFHTQNLISIECVVCASSSADIVWKSDGIGLLNIYVYDTYMYIIIFTYIYVYFLTSLRSL